MQGPSPRLVPVALVATLVAACEVWPPITTPPGCEASVVEVAGAPGGYRYLEQSIVLVIDPSIRDGVDEARVAALVEVLVRFSEVLVAGDRDGDGAPDFYPPAVLRIAVIGVDGTEVTAPTPALPPLEPDDADPLADGGLEVWPGEDAAWDAWLPLAVRARIETALALPMPTSATPIAAALTFGRAHRRFAQPLGTPAVIVLSDRDDSALSADTQGEWEETFGTGPSGVLLVAPIAPALIAPPGAGTDFDALLGAQAFDEGAVPCEDGARVGTYPRALLGLVHGLWTRGVTVGVASLCGTSVDVIGEVVIPKLGEVDFTNGLCLPRALPARSDGTVECTLTVTLPGIGPRRRCSDHELPLLALVDGPDARAHERCALPQVPRSLLGSGARGFVYDDFSTGLADECGPRGQRLAMSPALELPRGAQVRGECVTGTEACDFELATDRDGGAGDAR